MKESSINFFGDGIQLLCHILPNKLESIISLKEELSLEQERDYFTTGDRHILEVWEHSIARWRELKFGKSYWMALPTCRWREASIFGNKNLSINLSREESFYEWLDRNYSHNCKKQCENGCIKSDCKKRSNTLRGSTLRLQERGTSNICSLTLKLLAKIYSRKRLFGSSKPGKLGETLTRRKFS